MYFSTISVLLVSTALYGYTCNANKPPKHWQHNTRSINGLPDDRSNCFCYPEGQLPTVHDVLDSNNNGQERIVIYLYKTLGSNDINMYIPNPDKQVFIPDLPYEPGDGLTKVTTENIVMLFHNSPYKIKVFDNHFETINPTVVNSLPIGLNQGSIEVVYPKDVNELPQDLILKPVTPAIVTTSEVNNYNIEPNVQNEWSNNVVKYPYKNPAENKFVFTYNPPSVSVAKDYQTSNGVETFTAWFNFQMQRFKNSNLLHDIKAIDTNVLRLLVENVLSNSYISVSSDGIITDSKGIVIEPANLELRPVFLGQKFQHNLHSSSITIPKHLPFLEGILVAFVNPAHVLGIIPLGKTYLRQTNYLGESLGLANVNDTDILFDSYTNGNMASYTNAGSEPYAFSVKEIYTGANTVPISYTYSSVNENQISSNSYSNVYGPISVPHSYSTPNEQPYSGASKFSYWSSGPYVVPQKPYSTSSWNVQANGIPLPPSERRKLSEARIEHHYAPPVPKSKKKSTEARADILKEDDINPKEVVVGNLTESRRRFPEPSLTKIMKTLLNLLHELPIRTDSSAGANSTNGIDIVGESENLKNEDGPDFRIIGGNAATGSGTPLSNKGRSGFIN